MAGAADGVLLELDDMMSNMRRLLADGVSAMVDLISPDVIGPLARLLSLSNLAPPAGRFVHTSQDGKKGTDTVTGVGDPFVIRCGSALEQVTRILNTIVHSNAFDTGVWL